MPVALTCIGLLCRWTTSDFQWWPQIVAGRNQQIMLDVISRLCVGSFIFFIFFSVEAKRERIFFLAVKRGENLLKDIERTKGDKVIWMDLFLLGFRLKNGFKLPC